MARRARSAALARPHPRQGHEEAAERVKEEEPGTPTRRTSSTSTQSLDKAAYYDESTGEWVTCDQEDQTSWEQYPPSTGLRTTGRRGTTT